MVFDRRRADRGYGYVGASRVRRRADLWLIGHVRRTDWLPVGRDPDGGEQELPGNFSEDSSDDSRACEGSESDSDSRACDEDEDTAGGFAGIKRRYSGVARDSESEEEEDRGEEEDAADFSEVFASRLDFEAQTVDKDLKALFGDGA